MGTWNHKALFQKTNNGENPCNGCLKRSAECHATCQSYLKWHDEHVEGLKNIYREDNRVRKLYKDEIYRNSGRRRKNLMKKEDAYMKEKKIK